MLPSKIQILTITPLLEGLAQNSIEALAHRAIEKRYAAGEILFHEGDECAGLFVLGRGRVKIFKTSPNGREIMLAVESAPSSVAEVPLFDGGNYPASVIAIDEVVAYMIGKREFHEVCRQHPEVSLKVLEVVGRKLRHLVSIVESVTFGSIRQRLARALLELRDQAGADSFPMPFTHQELAQRLGTVREVISRNLGRFQAEGLLRMSGRDLQLLNRTGLEQEAETEMS
ncbi:MAG: Crp/Fnr family transcriptional regulator [Acidobacteriia bacterium]|nr:Crp/Fnr family transcriptional regulator [Terriglobia bacterium]